jgi:hypothetical protein
MVSASRNGTDSHVAGSVPRSKPHPKRTERNAFGWRLRTDAWAKGCSALHGDSGPKGAALVRKAEGAASEARNCFDQPQRDCGKRLAADLIISRDRSGALTPPIAPKTARHLTGHTTSPTTGSCHRDSWTVSAATPLPGLSLSYGKIALAEPLSRGSRLRLAASSIDAREI